jgi:RNA-directed DNA polymerase
MLHPWSPQPFAAEARRLGRSEETIAASAAAARTIKQRHVDLPVIFTLSHLAHLAGIAPATVRTYVTRARMPGPYRVFKLKKRPTPTSHAPFRSFRTICVPEPDLMRLQRWIAQNILATTTPHPASFAYAADRGILKAAEQHCGCTWLVKMDIRSFFDSIGERQVYRVFRRLGYGMLLSFELARICTRPREEEPQKTGNLLGISGYQQPREGRLPQGAPTSPVLANLAMHKLDQRLSHFAIAQGWVYTRYADDLAFSTKDQSDRHKARQLIGQVKQALSDFGLAPNEAKTVIAPPGARRIVLGLQVDGHVPRLTRDFRNNLETHLYALTATHIGPENHRRARGFASLIGMRRHISGLLAYAHYIEPAYASQCYAQFNAVVWPF